MISRDCHVMFLWVLCVLQASVDSTACEPSLGNCEAAGGVAAGGVADVGEGVTEEDLCSAYCSLAEVYLTDQW